MMKQFIALTCALVLSSISLSFSQGQHAKSIWQDVNSTQVRSSESWRRTLSLDEDLLKAKLAFANSAKGTVQMIELPYPDGTTKWFSYAPAAIMAPELAAKYSTIQTYKGQSADGQSIVRFDFTPKGFHAIIFDESRTVYIDPDHHLTRSHYRSYYRNDYKNSTTKTFIEDEMVSGDKVPFEPNKISAKNQQRVSSGTVMSKYRIAIAANGEYTTFHGGTVEGGLSAIVTSLNRVTGIYENEVAVTFELVADNDQIIYTSASTDPYSDGNELPENQANLDDVIGVDNYDIGHVFTTASGGLAGLGVVCGSRKAQGTTGTNNPIGDPFDVDYVAHEIGHQFGGNHTFNGSSGSCAGGNRNGNTAYEPGSGTTIMAYAGICAPQNTQNNSDPYFHVASLEQIVAFTTENGGSGCASTTETANTPPEVTVNTPSVTIPANTPFQLIGEATDVDGDELTYSWEQYDLGPTGHPNSPEENAAIFRVFSPVDHGMRTFPQTSDLVNGTQTMGEILPSYSRSMNFQLVVRDNNAAGGGINTEDLSLVVDEDAGPFVVTSQSESDLSYFSGTIQDVKWDVAGTNSGAVACESVRILLSIDGGENFDIVLVESTANDGSESVTIPNHQTDQARIKVEAIGNAFFNISDSDFAITIVEGEAFYIYTESSTASVCEPADAVYVINAGALNGFSGSIDLTFDGSSDLNSSFSATNMTIDGQVELTISDTDQLEDSDYTFTVVGTSGELSHSIEMDLQVWPSTLENAQLTTPADMATDVFKFTDFIWEVIPGAESYSFELSSESDFATLDFSETELMDTNFSMIEALNANQMYYWRVKGVNNCGEGDFVAASFNTLDEACFNTEASDLPITINAATTNTISSFITIDEDLILSDVNLMNLDIKHTYISDLVITLISPSGRKVTVMNTICDAEDDILISFDSESANITIPCPPTGGIYQPENSLEAFYGTASKGVWELEISDTYAEDGGSLRAWDLELCGQAPEAPDSPTNLVGVFDFDRNPMVELSWTSGASRQDGFIIERKMTSAENWTELETTSQLSYTDKNVELGENFNYRVYAYNIGGKSAPSNEITTQVILGISRGLEAPFQIYPNPSNGILKLGLDARSRSNIQEVRVVSVSGKTVYSQTSFPRSEEANELAFDLSGLPRGMYVVNITTADGLMAVKWLKE